LAGFASAQLKLDRAEEHLHALDDEILAYLDSQPFKIVVNVQPSDPSTVLIEFHVTTQPPERLSVILGDCIHNLRSSLDHIACDLVTKAGGSCDHTQFPIADSMLDKNANPKQPLTVGAAIDPQALAFIDALQPYHRGQDAPSHPLAIVRDLSNIDKHQTLHTTATYVTGTQVFMQFPDGILLGGQLTHRVARDQTVIGVFPLSEPFDPAANPDVEVSAGGSAFVAIEQAGPWADRPVAVLVDEVLQFIRRDVVAGLEPFLN
jgi:hypothetical protein